MVSHLDQPLAHPSFSGLHTTCCIGVCGSGEFLSCLIYHFIQVPLRCGKSPRFRTCSLLPFPVLHFFSSLIDSSRFLSSFFSLDTVFHLYCFKICLHALIFRSHLRCSCFRYLPIHPTWCRRLWWVSLFAYLPSNRNFSNAFLGCKLLAKGSGKQLGRKRKLSGNRSGAHCIRPC